MHMHVCVDAWLRAHVYMYAWMYVHVWGMHMYTRVCAPMQIQKWRPEKNCGCLPLLLWHWSLTELKLSHLARLASKCLGSTCLTLKQPCLAFGGFENFVASSYSLCSPAPWTTNLNLTHFTFFWSIFIFLAKILCNIWNQWNPRKSGFRWGLKKAWVYSCGQNKYWWGCGYLGLWSLVGNPRSWWTEVTHAGTISQRALRLLWVTLSNIFFSLKKILFI